MVSTFNYLLYVLEVKGSDNVYAAKRVQQDGEKKGWFGGWFGGKKEQSIGPGPIKAKLGEESSFYYDKELKKWVNKKVSVKLLPLSL